LPAEDGQYWTLFSQMAKAIENTYFYNIFFERYWTILVIFSLTTTYHLEFLCYVDSTACGRSFMLIA